MCLGSIRYRDEIAAALVETVEEKLKTPRVGLATDLPQETDPARPAQNTVVLVAIDPNTKLSRAETNVIQRALEAAIPVLPVLCGAAEFSDLEPPLSIINGLEWKGGDDVVNALFRLLGLDETDRKIFLSYKRSDSESVAYQVRYEMQDRGFDVFLDRFSVPPAVDFQGRLDEELSDKAFVLLIEGPSTNESEWVLHEVTYALRQHISLIALTLPEAQPAHLIASVPDEMRIRLHPEDVETVDGESVLTAACMAKLARTLEWEHALRLRRHRQQLVDSLSDWLRQGGHDVVSLPGWTLVATDGPNAGVYLVTPRFPTPADLRRVDLARQAVNGELSAVVAHNPELSDGDRRDLIVWITDRQGDLRAEHHAGLRLLMGAS